MKDSTLRTEPRLASRQGAIREVLAAPVVLEMTAHQSGAKPIYLDYNATTPHAPEVIEAIRPYLETEYGNPSSSHAFGVTPRKAIAESRRQVAALLNSRVDEVVFTSGGTESNNYAIIGAAMARRGLGNHVITTQIEHPAVLRTCGFLERNGFRVTYLPVDEAGMIRLSDLENAVSKETILITVMHANNEVGTIQPIAEISAIARRNGIVLHSDAAQSIGKIRADVEALGVDLLSVAGHKVYAPKGVGALYIRTGVELEPLMYGAGQENGRRPGTENVMQIVGLGKACEIAGRGLQANMEHMTETRDLLCRGLEERAGDIRLNGHPELRLPNTLSVSFRGIEANRLLEEIGPYVAASAGAACHSGAVEISSVLTAMRVPLEWAKGTLRFSTGRTTSKEEIERTVDVVCDAVGRIASNARSIQVGR